MPNDHQVQIDIEGWKACGGSIYSGIVILLTDRCSIFFNIDYTENNLVIEIGSYCAVLLHDIGHHHNVLAQVERSLQVLIQLTGNMTNGGVYHKI